MCGTTSPPFAMGYICAMNLICKGYDVGNAFAEAPAPTSPFFMKPDAQFRQWWEEHLGKDPIPEGYVIPVRKHYKDTRNHRNYGTRKSPG
jgi:hypothetical protein